MSDTALSGHTDEPAHVENYGPIPTKIAREVVSTGDTELELRRLYAKPKSGALVAMDSKSRIFPKALAALIGLRDQTYRTAYCDAPIRHIDHIVPHAHGGATTEINGQGLSEDCNYAKQAPRWSSEPAHSAGGRHLVVTTTPTGHRHRSAAPPVSRRRRRRPRRASPVEERLIRCIGGRDGALKTANSDAA